MIDREAWLDKLHLLHKNTGFNEITVYFGHDDFACAKWGEFVVDELGIFIHREYKIKCIPWDSIESLDLHKELL